VTIATTEQQQQPQLKQSSLEMEQSGDGKQRKQKKLRLRVPISNSETLIRLEDFDKTVLIRPKEQKKNQLVLLSLTFRNDSLIVEYRLEEKNRATSASAVDSERFLLVSFTDLRFDNKQGQ